VTSTEYVLSVIPFVVRRRVKWGECDPAQVVYTVSFSEYVISAAELFYGSLFEGTPQRIKDEHGFGTPSRTLSFDFLRSLRPDEEFDMTVSVGAINSRTYTLEIAARTTGGDDVFVAQLTPICVARGERRAIEIPSLFRTRLERHKRECATHGR
jgi:acyl-CoA thioester hydrolase